MSRKVIRAIDTLSNATGRGISYIILITVAATVIEVVARYVFNAPTVWSYEVEMFTCGILYVVVGAYCQLKRTHVSVDLLYNLMSKRMQRFFRLTVNFPLILIFSGALTYMGTEYAWTSIQMWERSYSSWGPLIWPVKMLLPIGSLLLVLQAVSDFLRDLFLVEDNGR